MNQLNNFYSKDLILGFFDGLHLGHKMLFNKAHKNFNILTFINLPNKTKDFLYKFDDRLFQLSRLNPMQINIFDVKDYNLTANDFCINVLKPMNFSRLIVGSDYTFGSDQKSVIYLKKFFSNVIRIPRNNISTTGLKNMLLTNNLHNLNNLLIMPYYRSGIVIKGNGYGTQLGYKTANIGNDESLISMQSGSYVTQTEIDNQIFPSVTFIGKSLTLETQQSYIETHILNFNNNIYDKKIKIYFFHFIRPNQKFDSIIDLKKNINNDIEFTKSFFWRI